MPSSTTRVVFRLDGGPPTMRFSPGSAPSHSTTNSPSTGFRTGLARHVRAPSKAVLLDQAIVAGIGNIYADESLP